VAASRLYSTADAGLKDLLLDPDGVTFPPDSAPVPLLCSVCHSSLKNNKLPPISLANKPR
jgi:hypothetical protein